VRHKGRSLRETFVRYGGARRWGVDAITAGVARWSKS
ncbi:MAG: hypothetical protein JWR43_1970, partial [Phenylobacterium sp.]|nr:hypothetical protein [Phenylobacterium sp.]